MPSPPRLPRKPEARTEKIEDLVERVRRGLIRVPRFQRGLKWKSSDVVELFDSLYRGYPIGSLLFYKRSAKADRLPLGTRNLPELAAELTEVGMGRLDENRLLTCLFALRGLDPTRSLAEHCRRDPEVLRDAVQDALPVLRRVLSFLRKDAGILHLRLLPKSILPDVLTRFFLRNEDPSQRTRTLLARWFWRTLVGAFLKMLAQSGLERSRSAANRVIHPRGTPIHRLMRDRISIHGMDDPVLGSHAIDARAAELLAVGDLNGFLGQRSLTLTAEVRRFAEWMAAWDHNDRPSVEYLLVEAGVEV